MSACPICKKAVKARAENKCFPFCSERCKQIDLGKWLSEEYGVAAEDEGLADGKDLS
jgi:endogenous inhibitor of DNA gyrase (YacG/DUF329 family)